MSLFLSNIASASKPSGAGGGGGGDPVADFLTATGIVDTTIEDALTDLYDSLVTDGIWDKCVAIYPFVGGTSTTHKYNLKDARDLDAAFRLVFSGGVTHDANGITGNGSTGTADTKLTPATTLTANDTHVSVYCRTDSAGANIGELGTVSASNKHITLQLKTVSGFAASNYHLTTGNLAAANSDSRGHYIVTRRAAADAEMYRNGSSISTHSGSSGSLPDTTTLKLMSIDSANYSNRNLAFVSVGASLSDTEASDFYTAVQAFQTALSRNV